MKEPKYCFECKYGKLKGYDLRCFNPKVNAKDYWALASKGIPGSATTSERELKWYSFPACGMAGKLWEEKFDLEDVIEI